MFRHFRRIVPLARLSLVLALIAAGIAAVPAAHAASFVVTTLADDVPGSLREAMLNANATSGADTITFSVIGTITLTHPLPDISDSLTITGPGADSLTISGGDTVRIFNVPFGVTLSLNDLTLSHGAGDPEGGAISNTGTINLTGVTMSNSHASVGGAILNTGVANLTNSTLTANYASSYAPALYNRGGTVTLRGTTVANNTSQFVAGVMNDLFGTLHVIDSTFSGNTWTPTSAILPFQSGIAINNLGTMDISGSSFIHNQGPNANGTVANSGTAAISNSTFVSNVAWFGGAINNSGTLSVSGSTFGSNVSTQPGGAIFNSGTLVVSNSTAAANIGFLSGSGIASGSGSVTLINTTLVDNISNNAYSSNLYVTGGTITLKNTLLSNSGLRVGDCDGTVTPSGGTNNLAPDGSCGPSATVVAASALKLAPLGQNGGPTLTVALQPGSAAIDAGDPATCAADPINSLDQRGIARPQGASCDIGAFELVQAINHPPVAANDSYTTPAGQPLVVDYLHGVLQNDSDADLTPLIAIKVSDPAHGTLVLNADGSFTYTPVADFSGVDSFTYKANDYVNDSNVATVTITVTPAVISPPKITIVLDTQPNSPRNFAFSGGLGNFILDDITPQDGDPYSSSKTFTVAAGTYTVTQSLPGGWYNANISCNPPANTIADLTKNQIVITAAAGANITCTFVTQRAGQLVVDAYNDQNHNHVRDQNEAGLRSWNITLYSLQTGATTRKSTDRSGSVSFSNLRPGSYAVCEALPAGWFSITPGTVDPRYGQPCYSLTVNPGAFATAHFGNSTKP
jgi:hypothetical protein